MRKDYLTTGVLCIVFALVCLFAAFVWPTRYVYHHAGVGGNQLIVRIDRFSGKADILLFGKGWVSAENVNEPRP
jgi:hypothetical protein